MSDILKKPYEISVWEDVVVYVDVWGNQSKNISELHNPISYQYLTEQRIGVIGSDTMDTPIQARNPILNQKLNGETTFTFTLFYHYTNENGELVQNPWTKYLVNEKKIKLWYDDNDSEDKWHDFIIKNVQENSSAHTFTYTCSDLASVELSKQGFSIQLDTELENNQGTVNELADYILSGSDWQRDIDYTPIIKQYNNEAIYKLTLSVPLVGIRNTLSDETFHTIAAGKSIYVYYTSYVNNPVGFYQFIYSESGTPTISDDNVTIFIDNEDTFDLYTEFVPDFTADAAVVTMYRGDRLVKSKATAYDATLDKYVNIYKNGDGEKRYGYTESEYLTAETVQNFCYNGTAFASNGGWAMTNDNSTVEDVVYPPVTHTSIIGDFTPYLLARFNGRTNPLLNFGPQEFANKINTFSKGEKYVMRLRVGQLNENNITLFTKDNISNVFSSIKVARCALLDGSITDEIFTFSNWQNGEDGFIYAIASAQDSFSYSDLIHSTSTRKTSIRFQVQSAYASTDLYFRDVEFFKYAVDADGQMVLLNSVPSARVMTRYNYYDPAQNTTALDESDYIFEYSDYEDSDEYSPYYEDGEGKFEKRRSITASESNRFNLLQQLCETFECWVRFKINHNEDGSIAMVDNVFTTEATINRSYDGGETSESSYIGESNDGTGERTTSVIPRLSQDKRVIFFEDIKVDNYAGFKYGINLESIQRTLESKDIVTKIIVKPNSCEYATDGSAMIARASDNPIKENYAYDFDYYTQQGIINPTILTNDLYGSQVNGYIGLYPRLARINKDINEKSNELSIIDTSIDRLTSEVTVYDEAVAASQQNFAKQNSLLGQDNNYVYADYVDVNTGDPNELVLSYPNTKYNYEGSQPTIRCYLEDGTTSAGSVVMESGAFTTPARTRYIKIIGDAIIYVKAARDKLNSGDGTPYDATISSYIIQMQKYKAEIEKNQALLDQQQASLDAAKEQQRRLLEELEEISAESDAVEREFLSKYSRYIQEGSWNDDNYIDDNLYYLDALNILATSAFPAVSYTINVIELSQLEGYSGYTFNIGNKTYIEDTEFFGWKIVDGVKTPAREEVIVSEISWNLDDPKSNVIKIQNYKTQFEDLFQRITAATQQLQFHEGEYSKAAGIVTSAGTIETSVLEASMYNANTIIQNAQNQSVTWNSTGITISKETAPSELIRLTSGGIAISKDGGASWQTAITPGGVNASLITAGELDTASVRIKSGNWDTFRWDDKGLRAFSFDLDGDIPYNFDQNRYVTFDRYGIYGINGSSEFIANGLDSVEQNALFALTWNGLFVRSMHDNGGHISISPTEDIVIYDGNNVKRGQFGVLEEEELVPHSGDTTFIASENERDETGDNGESSEELAYSDESLYGISLFDANGNRTLVTRSNGTLWLSSAMTISPENSNDEIFFGVGELVEDKPGVYKVLSIFDGEETLRIDSDGYIYAKNTSIEGEITATGGKIGPVRISEEGLIGESAAGESYRLTDSGIIINNNGIFKILGNDGEELFSASNGNLVITGSIEATAGKIGGFTITDNSLASDGLVITSSTEDTPSSISVENILIGSGAKFDDDGRLEIGNLVLRAPTDDDDSVLRLTAENTNYFYINNDGEVGGIGWDITTDGIATFNNAIINGEIQAAKISTAVFEINKVQAMGGKFIFKSSAYIDQVGTFVYNDDDEKQYRIYNVDKAFLEEMGEATKYCFINYEVQTESQAKIATAIVRARPYSSTQLAIILEEEGIVNPPLYNEEEILKSIVLLGDSDSKFIAINSDKRLSGDIDNTSLDLFVDEALNIGNFRVDNGKYAFAHNLILGNLDGRTDFSENLPMSGYGLYADNVYLSGQLSFSESGESFSAGWFNTKSTVIPIPRTNGLTYADDDFITIATGAATLRDSDIANANFFVTKTGKMYAKDAYIENSSFVGAKLTAAEIETAKITGIGQIINDSISEPGLILEFSDVTPENPIDSVLGILFQIRHQNSTSEIEKVLGINYDGIYYQDTINPIFRINRTSDDYNISYYGGEIVLKDRWLQGEPKTFEINYNGLKFADGYTISLAQTKDNIQIDGSTNINGTFRVEKTNSVFTGNIQIKGDNIYYVEEKEE